MIHNEEQIVNFFVLMGILDPLAPRSRQQEVDDEVYNSASEETMRLLIRQKVLPYFSRFNERSKKILKSTLVFYMSFDHRSLEGAFDNNQIAFSLTDDPLDFYSWLWEELFPGENYRTSDPDSFVMMHDTSVANRVQVSG